MPEDVEEVAVSYADVEWSQEDLDVSPDGFVGFQSAGIGPVHLGIRLDRLLVKCGLADSVSDAVRKLKAASSEKDSVKILDQSVADLEYAEQRSRILVTFHGSSARLMLRVGRKVKIAVIQRHLSS